MKDYKKHLINKNANIKKALLLLNELSSDAILFVVDNQNKLIGSFTDGDVRRGLISGCSIDELVINIIQKNSKFIYANDTDLSKLISFRKGLYRIIPVLDNENKVVDVINFKETYSKLPLDAFIMAGGKGTRLLPLTSKIPKPLLPVGNKPIIQYNIDRLSYYGIKKINISINYLGEKIIEYFGDGSAMNLEIKYIKENKPLGTIGSLSKVKNFSNDYVLVINSDLLTNIDIEDFFMDFLKNDADMSIVCTSYEVKIPYGVFELENNNIKGLVEKPTYNYFSNAGIYILKKDVLDEIEIDTLFDATDLIKKLINKNKKIISYKFPGYWLDIGKMIDYEKAQSDIENIKLY